MGEARRATAALAALVIVAVVTAALLAHHLARWVAPHVGTMGWFCTLPGMSMTSSPGRGAAVPMSAWVSFVLLTGGFVLALARLGRTLLHARRIGRLLAAAARTAVSSRGVARVASRTGALGLPVRPVIADLEDRPAAFTLGLLRPRIVVSAAVVEALTDVELDALLMHEAAHARRRDPLRLLVAGFCRDVVFFLPIGHTLFALVREAQERAADDAAAEAAGTLEVASALITVLKVAGHRPAMAMVPAAAGADPEARIRRLLDAPGARRSRETGLHRVGTTALISGALLMGLAAAPDGATGMTLAGCCAPVAAWVAALRC